MRFRLHQTAVYWAPTGMDRQGRPLLADPVEVTCRWEDAINETVAPDGTSVVATSHAWMTSAVLVGGLMMLGALADLGSGFPTNPRDDARVREVVTTGAVPSVNARQTLYDAMLR